VTLTFCALLQPNDQRQWLFLSGVSLGEQILRPPDSEVVPKSLKLAASIQRLAMA